MPGTDTGPSESGSGFDEPVLDDSQTALPTAAPGPLFRLIMPSDFLNFIVKDSSSCSVGSSARQLDATQPVVGGRQPIKGLTYDATRSRSPFYSQFGTGVSQFLSRRDPYYCVGIRASLPQRSDSAKP